MRSLTRANISHAALCLLGVLAIVTTNLAAQQPEPLVQLGVLKVPPCPPAADPEYGLAAAKAIPIGGGPMYMAARQRRYLEALRGPKGQTVRVVSRVTTSVLHTGEPQPTLIDSYSVNYDGDSGPVAKTIFMDAYHYDAPRVPAGFTCGAPLATVAFIPPADPFEAGPATVSLAVEQGTAGDVAPIPLDPMIPRGYLFDQFGSIALRARTAALAGAPINAKNPPRDLESNGLTVLVNPVRCGDRTIAPTSVELTTAQGVVTREAALGEDELPKAFPGLPTPAGSRGFRFRNAQPTAARVTYAEGCDGAAPDVVLPLRVEAPRLVQLVPGVLPPGMAEADAVVYIQVIIDPEGHIARPHYLGGPRPLYPAAVDALAKWKVEPIRVNGAPVATPNVLQVPFRP